MKLKCLACEALARLVYLYAAHSPHIVDIELFQLGWHNDPSDLRARLQARIDAVGHDEYDAIVMAYGLCGQATAGLVARDTPIVIPRAHDCITLFLGSRERYTAESTAHPGTYWYVQDYIERNPKPGTTLSLGSGTGDEIGELYAEYVKKYGQDNADYLIEVMGAWQQHYDRAVYIDLGVGDGAGVETQTRETAARRGWTFERMPGDPALIRQLLQGDWNNDFVILSPGKQIVMSYDQEVLNSG